MLIAVEHCARVAVYIIVKSNIGTVTHSNCPRPCAPGPRYYDSGQFPKLERWKWWTRDFGKAAANHFLALASVI
jgi:hypothetical protein